MNNLNRSGIAIGLILISCSLWANSQSEYELLGKQMGIMSDIIKSSSHKNPSDKSLKIHHVDQFYLAGQGAVFNLRTGAGPRLAHSEEALIELVPPTAPIAPVIIDSNYGDNFEVIIEHSIEEANSALELAKEQLRLKSDQSRELREQHRQLSYELRDLERAKRDLNYQKLHSQDKDKDVIEQDLAKLELREATLEKNREQLKEKKAALRKQLRTEQQEKFQRHQELLQQLEVNVTQSLCDYGGGLKALPADEHVTIVFTNSGVRTRTGIKDKVMVFKKKDIRECALENIKADTLLSRATRYQF
ncbi:hypothetical protein [Thalassotalea aquiviva]|uniref:hypothetical protein n=1 Tax=Thalassotalea aquiviva TaxID=3242415 RepID=UPI00352B82AD